MVDLRGLFVEYSSAVHMSTKPNGLNKLRPDFIKDENQSVKWNRHFVEENNRKYVEEVAKLQRKRSLEINRIQSKIEKYVQKETGVTTKGARAIFNHAYSQGHSGGIYAVQGCLLELIELFKECREK